MKRKKHIQYSQYYCKYRTSLNRITPLTLFRKSLPDYFPTQQDVKELRAQITQDVHVDVDAAKGHNLARIMEEMRAKYEKITLKNQEDLKNWHEAQVIRQCQYSSNTFWVEYPYKKEVTK